MNSSSDSVAVLSTGVANVASLCAALRRQGTTPFMVDGPTDVLEAKALVIPGVGSFGPAIEQIERLGLRASLAERFEQGRKTLTICLGMQLTCDGSEEAPAVQGLGLISAKVQRISDSVRVPQLGWNDVEPDPNCVLLESGQAYFANSYCLRDLNATRAVATSSYAGDFVAAFEVRNWLACQFHPELSGAYGARLLDRWLSNSGGV